MRILDSKPCSSYEEEEEENKLEKKQDNNIEILREKKQRWQDSIRRAERERRAAFACLCEVSSRIQMQLTITESKKNVLLRRGIKEDGWSLVRDKKTLFESCFIIFTLFFSSRGVYKKPEFFITFRPPSGRILHMIEGGSVRYMDGREES